MRWRLLILVGAFGLLSLGGKTVNIGGGQSGVFTGGGTPKAVHSMMMIVVDDWGQDQNTLYYPSSKAITPNLNTLAATGVRYTKAITNQSCSPSRASALTGLYPLNTGIGLAINPSNPTLSASLNTDLQTSMDAMRAYGVRTIAIGKWHLAGVAYNPISYSDHAHAMGFDYWEGTPQQANFGGGVHGYSDYYWCEDIATCTFKTAQYLTEYTADRAIAKIPAAGSYFMWLAFNAAHEPHHCPPDALTPTYDAVCTPIGGETAAQAQYHAMLEVADAQIQRVVNAVNLANTTVCVAGDNGTSSADSICEGYPAGQCKATAYLGGSRIPLVCFGADVTTTGTSSARINLADLATTWLDATRTPQSVFTNAAGNSISFFPTFSNTASSPRDVSYAAIYTPNGYPAAPDPASLLRGAEDSRYYLARLANGSEALFDIQVDQFATTPLNLGALTAGEQASYNKLKAKIDNP